MTMRMRAGTWAGFVTALGTTIFLLIGRYFAFLPVGIDLRRLALYVDPDIHPILAIEAGAVNHVVAGSAIGFLYGWLILHFSARTGIAFLMISWFALMLIILPAIGDGLFGLRAGSALAVWTFVLHVIFGASMGRLAQLRVPKFDSEH
jgi:hypothetical protein